MNLSRIMTAANIATDLSLIADPWLLPQRYSRSNEDDEGVSWVYWGIRGRMDSRYSARNNLYNCSDIKVWVPPKIRSLLPGNTGSVFRGVTRYNCFWGEQYEHEQS